jgi:hypothetical protein
MTAPSAHPCPMCGSPGLDGHPQAASLRSFCGQCGCQYATDGSDKGGSVTYAQGGRVVGIDGSVQPTLEPAIGSNRRARRREASQRRNPPPVSPLAPVRLVPGCSCLDAARAYRAAGHHPVAVRRDGALVRTDGTTSRPSPEELAEDWAACPDANVGLALAGPHRLVAVEVRGERGKVSLEKLEAESGPFPRDSEFVSPGVRLFIFTAPAEMGLGAATPITLAPGVTVQLGGFVLVAPSMVDVPEEPPS